MKKPLGSTLKWKNTILRDFVFFQRGFDITKTEQIEGNIPVISSSGITSYHSKSIATGPGVIIGRKGTLGTVFYSKSDYWPHDTTLWSKNFKNNNPRFVYYFIKTLKLENYNVGNANPTLNRNHIHTLKIRIPQKDEQEKIADILSAYDDLIDINRRRIQLLEETARLLFREWFAYFRFPGHEKVKIVNGVPEGWEKRKLFEVADIKMGQSPKSKYYNEEKVGLPFHQGVTGFGDRYPTNQIYCTQENRIAQSGDILFSVRAPVGRINISTEKIIIGRGLSAIRSKNNYQSYLFYKLKNHFFKEDMIGGGSIFAAITKDDLEKVLIMYPDKKNIEQFENITKLIDKKIKNLSIQNQKLAQAQDLLLPRLMSGAIEV